MSSNDDEALKETGAQPPHFTQGTYKHYPDWRDIVELVRDSEGREFEVYTINGRRQLKNGVAYQEESITRYKGHVETSKAHVELRDKQKPPQKKLDRRSSHNSKPKKVVSPPGSIPLKLAEFLCSKKTYERVYHPLIAEEQQEYIEAISKNRWGKAKWIRIRMIGSFCLTTGTEFCAFLFSKPIEKIKALLK